MWSAMLVAVGIAAPPVRNFPCTIPDGIPPEPASNISMVHPAHVSVVMAFGDSITAAFSARSTLDEARDLSWSIGSGSDDQITMPYLLGKYRAATPEGKTTPLTGMSTKPVIPRDITHLPHDDYHPATDHLNFAESEGAVHRGSLAEQWSFALEQTSKIKDFDDRWKVATVWMTANDVCGECKHSSATDGRLAVWLAGMDEFMMNISTSTKKIYISMIGTFPLSNVSRVQRSNLECTIEHHIIDECGCIDTGSDAELQLMDDNVLLFNAGLANLTKVWSTKFKAQGRDDIAVVYHDFMTGRIGSQLDRSYLSGLDCFHPSAKAHQALAIGLWDSMICGKDRAFGRICGALPTIEEAVIQCPNASTTLWIP